MSDPMTKQTADEVLASIRRLVSETHGDTAPEADFAAEETLTEALTEALTTAVRAEPEAAPHEEVAPFELKREARATSDAPAGEGALILSPSFRVSQSERAEDEATAETDQDDQAPAEPLVLSLDQAVHLPKEREAEEIEAEDEAAPTTLEALIAEEVDLARAQPIEEPETSEDWSASLDDTPDAEAAAHVADLSLEQRIAELEAAVGAQSYEWEPDGSEDMTGEIPHEMPRAFAEAGARVLHFRARQEDKPEMTEARDDRDEIDDAEVIEETPSTMDAGFEDTDFDEAFAADIEVADLEAAEIDEAEIEDAEIVDDVPTQAFDDVEEAQEAPETTMAPDPEPNLEEELALAGYADEDIMDEEALRDLVAQVIREELQGELGQRITRNVRLLVRREVQRAMSLREFE